MPAADELQADRQSVVRPAAGHRQRGVARQVERERIGVPGAADRAGVAPVDLDLTQRIEPDRQRRGRQGRRGDEVAGGEDFLDLAEAVRPRILRLAQIRGARSRAPPPLSRSASDRASPGCAWLRRRAASRAASAASRGKCGSIDTRSSSIGSTCHAERLGLSHRGDGRGLHLRVEPVSASQQETDARLFAVREPSRRGCLALPVGIAAIRPGQHVEQQRACRRRCGPSGRRRSWRRTDRAPAGVGMTPSVALRPTIAAARGGNADRAAAVGAKRERPHARGDRNGRAAATSRRRCSASFQGLSVRPKNGPSVKGLWPNSGVVVLPMRIAPAARARATATASAAGTWFCVREPSPAWSQRLRWWSGPSPKTARHAAGRARRRACTAASAGLGFRAGALMRQRHEGVEVAARSSMRANAASTASTGEIFLSRIAAARSHGGQFGNLGHGGLRRNSVRSSSGRRRSAASGR